MTKHAVTVTFYVEAETKEDAAEAVDFALGSLWDQTLIAPEVFDEDAEWLGFRVEALTPWRRVD